MNSIKHARVLSKSYYIVEKFIVIRSNVVDHLPSPSVYIVGGRVRSEMPAMS
ncbi:hypothetical protein CRM22_010420, partial [Opisthorchis felineus]